ncbi:Rhomboid family member 1 [Wickerhamomyces ciferrii]|uniref:Rhomboid-type serine protease n=1 Tax=Wickerhamomyces ciferrii (strain ATCC 14091 / BCRC 22168 / CBS 111 / JCM 3599 / NBRC 0793 / NRRL Y-1031 F-60-10) TaxID=1206466 RepID=K0KEN1_WICCF|nr:Rhomboid family member 1 [Wickerhamomyces ciferrii]CCH41381.1 Rhomboid family member 1 [Wickerhamomyces ciferrii]
MNNNFHSLPPLPPKRSSILADPVKATNTTDTSYSPLRDQFIQNANPMRQNQHGQYNQYHGNKIIRDDEDSINNIPLKDIPSSTNYNNNMNSTNTNLPLLYNNNEDPNYNKKFYNNKTKNNIPLGYKIINFPYFTIIVTIIDIIIFIVELVKMKNLTGSAFQTKPYFNPMLGPSSNVQIYLGSRFAPCMHSISGITDSNEFSWPCPNSTTTDTQVCSLIELCNLGENFQGEPNQIWRLISAMFLHAGFVHILFNLLLQCTMGLDVEKQIGTLRYMIIYLVSGISGNVLGVNFAQDGISSSGASGALFGIIAVNLLIFVLHRDRSTVRYYGFMISILVLEVVVCLVLGLLPGLDNFCHIGGFVGGLLLGLLMLNDPKFIRLKRHTRGLRLQGFGSFSKHMQNIRKDRFIIWIIVRIVALVLIIAWFVGLILNFKNGGGNCSWCKYFNCLPVNNWCSQGDITTSTSTSSTSSPKSSNPF